MKTNKPRAIIVSIDYLNKNFEVKITSCPISNYAKGVDSEKLLPLPKSIFSEYFELGDEIEFNKFGKYGFEIINLSCQVIRLSKFKRDLISILRRLDNDEHLLKRCILLNESGFVLLSAKKNPEKINSITESTGN